MTVLAMQRFNTGATIKQYLIVAQEAAWDLKECFA